MSTTPTNPTPQSPKRIRLGPIAAALAVILVIAFGVCAANLKLESDSPPIVNVAVGVEIACVIGLIALLVIAFVRNNKPN
jgi:hypothetical protein